MDVAHQIIADLYALLKREGSEVGGWLKKSLHQARALAPDGLNRLLFEALD